MNKTLSIGLAGFSFIIEEHAYIKLSDYLAALRNSLDTEEADEVMHDIEIRMVEIFKDSLGKREVIKDTDVEVVINQIGRPEQIEEQEEAYFSETTKQRRNSGAYGQRQLFRDPERQKIAGVCAGLAHYTGMDISLMRAIWLGIAILGIFTAAISTSLIIVLYIILWIVLPKAETAADFLKMKGKAMNFGNLKEESTKIVQFANESSQRVGEIYTESKPYIHKAGSGIMNLIRYILGSIFALMGITMLIGAFAIFGFYDNSNVDFMGNIGFYLKDNRLGFLAIAFAFLSAFIPALIFVFLAIKLLSPRTRLNYIGYVFAGLVLLWLGLLGFIGYAAIKQGTMYSGHNEETENVAINTVSDSLYIDIKKVQIPQNFKSYWEDVYSDGKTIYKQDYINIDVKREDISAPYLTLKKRADGYNLPLQLQIPLEIKENRILFPNYIIYDYKNRFRDYRIDYELVVPKNTTIIKAKVHGIYLNDDDRDDEDAQYGNSSNTSGTAIAYSSENKDSVEINGKRYPKPIAEKMLDSMNVKIDNLRNVNINIKDGKKEISIKTE